MHSQFEKQFLTEMALCNKNGCVKSALVYDILDFNLQIPNVKTYLEKKNKVQVQVV